MLCLLLAVGELYRLASSVAPHAFEDRRQSLAAGVHHAGLFQYREEVGCPRQRGLGRQHGVPEHCREVGAVRGADLGRLGAFADDGQDGSFDRLDDGPVSEFGCLLVGNGEVFGGECSLCRSAPD